MFLKDYFILSCILKFFLKTNSYFQKNYLQWTPYILSNFYSQEVFMPIDGYGCISYGMSCMLKILVISCQVKSLFLTFNIMTVHT